MSGFISATRASRGETNYFYTAGVQGLDGGSICRVTAGNFDVITGETASGCRADVAGVAQNANRRAGKAVHRVSRRPTGVQRFRLREPDGTRRAASLGVHLNGMEGPSDYSAELQWLTDGKTLVLRFGVDAGRWRKRRTEPAKPLPQTNVPRDATAFEVWDTNKPRASRPSS